MTNLTGKVALVTGAGSGIGRATARTLAARGACVVIADISPDSAQSVAEEISSRGGTASAVSVDICVEEQIRAALEEAVRRYGRLDILHNNAAFAPQDVLAEDVDLLGLSTETWDRVMQGTLRGTMLGCRYGVIAMRKSGGGSIINTSSMYGVSAFNRMPAYSTSKAAINFLTQYVATAYGRDGIRCNAVAPCMIRTPLLEAAIPEAFIVMNEEQTLTGALGSPDDIANIVAFLASDESRQLTGQIIHADAGTTAHLPTYASARNFYAQT